MKKLSREVRVKVYAIYDLTNGQIGVPVPPAELQAHIEKLGLEQLSSDELDAYAHRVIDRVMKQAWEKFEPMRFPGDYEACSDCGFDHDYEAGDAHERHLELP